MTPCFPGGPARESPRADLQPGALASEHGLRCTGPNHADLSSGEPCRSPTLAELFGRPILWSKRARVP
eukprot:11822292-Alexandrium_andersonii.AAC.1